MIYISQLISDEELKDLTSKYHTGVELVDFSIGMNLDELKTCLNDWKKRLDAMGNPPLTLHGPFLDLNPVSYDSMVAQATWNRFSRTYEAAKILGAGKIVYHTCRVPAICYLTMWPERMAEFWNAFLQEHNDIPVAVENVFDEAPEPIAQFASRIEHSHFSLCLDVGHAHCFSDVPLEQWLKVLSPWISHLHLHDNHGQRDEHLPLGAGSLSLEELIAFLPSLDKLDSIVLENTSIKDCRQSLDFILQLLLQHSVYAAKDR